MNDLHLISETIKFCPSCMTTHRVWLVKRLETGFYKGVQVYFYTEGDYCYKRDTIIESEDQIEANFKEKILAYNLNEMCELINK